MVAVQVEVGTLAHTLELDEDLGVAPIPTERGGNRESLAIPADGICEVNDILHERLVAIEGIGQRHLLPPAVIKCSLGSLWEIAYTQTPVGIEVELYTS